MLCDLRLRESERTIACPPPPPATPAARRGSCAEAHTRLAVRLRHQRPLPLRQWPGPLQERPQVPAAGVWHSWGGGWPRRRARGQRQLSGPTSCLEPRAHSPPGGGGSGQAHGATPWHSTSNVTGGKNAPVCWQGNQSRTVSKPFSFDVSGGERYNGRGFATGE